MNLLTPTLTYITMDMTRMSAIYSRVVRLPIIFEHVWEDVWPVRVVWLVGKYFKIKYISLISLSIRTSSWSIFSQVLLLFSLFFASFIYVFRNVLDCSWIWERFDFSFDAYYVMYVHEFETHFCYGLVSCNIASLFSLAISFQLTDLLTKLI